MDINNLWNSIPQSAQQIIIGMAGEVAASMVSAGGFQVKKRFAATPRQEALARAVSRSLAATALAISDNPTDVDHTLTLLGEWLADEAVIGELSRIIDPQPDVELDTAALTAAFEEAGFDAETVGQGLGFAVLIAIFADAFYNAAAAEDELDGPIKIALLREMASHAKATMVTNEQQVAILERILAALDQRAQGDTIIVNMGEGVTGAVVGKDIQIRSGPAGPDFSALEQPYLAGLYADCNGLPLVKVKDHSQQPRLQRVYVDLNSVDSPSVATVRVRLEASGVDLAPLRAALQTKIDEWSTRGDVMMDTRLADVQMADAQMAHMQMRQWDDPLDLLAMLQPSDRGALERELELTPGVLADVCAGEPVLAALQRDRQLVLLGDPGSGKSTLTRRLAGMMAALGHETLRKVVSPGDFAWAQGVQDSYGRWLLPVRVVLSRWARHLTDDGREGNGDGHNIGPRDGCADDLITECVRILGETGNVDQQKQHFVARLTADPPTVILLLDGLDEVAAPEQREHLLAAITHFCDRYANVPLMVTCRVRPYEQGEAYTLPLPATRLEPLSRPAIDEFLQRWYAELVRAKVYQSAEKAEQRRKTLATVLRSGQRPELSDMAGGPLLLTMMAHVNYDHGLPDNRAELYERFVQQLLWEWDRIRQDDRGQETGLEILLRAAGMEKTHLESALDELAYAVHGQERNERDTVDITRRDLEDTLRAAHPGKDEARKAAWAVHALELIDARSGLIYAREQGKVYNFTHRTFQEYMAARYLGTGSTRVIIDQFKAKIDDDQWREAIFLALGYQIQLRADFDNAISVLADLLPQTPRSKADWRRVLLLGEAYVRLNGPQAIQRSRLPAHWKEDVRQTVPCLLTAAMQNPDLSARQRLDAGLLADDLKLDPPGLDDFLPKDGRLTTPDGDRFRIGKYPVTNKQYRRFVEAGGYAPENEKGYWSDDGLRYKHDQNWTEPRYWDNSRFNRATQPVVGVSWYEASAYCAWLTAQLRKAGEIGENEEARLPSQAEWEAAAHSTHGKEYPWGSDEFNPARANTKDSGLGQTTPVHMYEGGCTSDGVWDLSGNVWEWMNDWREGRYPWLKGGSWYEDGVRASASARLDWFDWLGGGGWRVVVVPISR